MPTPRSGIGVAVLNGRMHVVGGEAYLNDLVGTYRTHEAFDPKTNGWQRLPPMPTPRHGLAVAEIGGKMYAVSGSNVAGGGGPHEGVNVNEVYDPEVCNTALAGTGFDDRLGENPKADHGVPDHQQDHRDLTPQRSTAAAKNPQRRDMGQIHRDQVAEHHGDDSDRPLQPRRDEADVHLISGGPEQVPSAAERIGQSAGLHTAPR